jgi:hypothetical protein
LKSPPSYLINSFTDPIQKRKYEHGKQENISMG